VIIAGLKQKWAALSAREKRLLGIGLPILGLVFYWLFLYRPLAAAVQKAEARNRALIQQWHWMQQQLPAVRTGAAGAAVTSPRDPSVPLLTWLDDQLATAQLQAYVKRLDPVDDARVTLWLEKVPFTPLMRWLQQMQTGQGILITEFDAMPVTGSPGLSTVRLTLYAP